MSLRIISGERRGAKLRTLEGNATRPLRDRVRESLFNILRPQIDGVRVLDAFAGSGAVGLEALSNGASFATFVEPSKAAAAIVEANIGKLRYEDRTLVLKGKSPDAIPAQGKPGAPFDILFLMPPYGTALCNDVLSHEGVLALCASDALAICEVRKDERLADQRDWRVEDKREYGVTHLVFLRRV